MDEDKENLMKQTPNSYSDTQYTTMRTAFLTAFPKIFTNIEFSIDIFSNMKELAIRNGFSFSPNLFSNEMSVEIEARHKALNRALDKYISKDVLVIEIAAGLSPRHLQYSDYNYYELDFNPIIDIKKNLYTTMGYEFLNNSLYGLDITDVEALHKCLNNIIKQTNYSKIIILNEGLFWYLTKNQIKNIANEFINSLLSTNWIWITSDCPTTDKNESAYRKIISDSAKVTRGTFLDYNDFLLFFKDIGLNNKRYKLSDFLDYKDLSSATFFSFDEHDTIMKINTYTDIAILCNKRNNKEENE